MPCQVWLADDHSQSKDDNHTKERRQSLPRTGRTPSHLPYSLIDIVRMEHIRFSSEDQGRTVQRTPIPSQEAEALSAHVRPIRQYLVDTLTELDDEFLEHMLTIGDENIYHPSLTGPLEAALRRQTVLGRTVPAFFGSALKNIGVQPVMDAIVKYLPNPLERPPPKASVLAPFEGSRRKGDNVAETVAVLPDAKDRLCALAFKVVHDPRRGLLTFVRVYSGGRFVVATSLSCDISCRHSPTVLALQRQLPGQGTCHQTSTNLRG